MTNAMMFGKLIERPNDKWGWYGQIILLNTPIPKYTKQALPWTRMS